LKLRLFFPFFFDLPYFFAGPFPRPPPDGFPVVLGQFPPGLVLFGGSGVGLEFAIGTSFFENILYKKKVNNFMI